MKTAKYLPAVAAMVAALVSAPSFADSADVRFSIGDVSFGIDVGTPPPAPVVEYVPVAVPGHVWVPGYWAWDGHRHVWNSGVWEKARSGYSHVAGRWEQRGDHWHFEPSRWESHKAVERRSEKREYVQHVRDEDHRDRAYNRDSDSRRDYSR
jgi:hypothetical protein